MILRTFKCDCENYFTSEIEEPTCPLCGCKQTLKNLKRSVIKSEVGGGDNRHCGDYKSFYSLEFGKCGKNAQAEYRKTHPGAEFGPNNGLKITSAKQLRDLQKETGMVNLCESREYREQYREGVERAKSEEHSKKN